MQNEEIRERDLSTSRHKTAMTRYSLSRPISLALQDGIINSSTSVFDFGCGKGQDVRLLSSQGMIASGWDPHFEPDSEIREADVVNLGYVLNVIEEPNERATLLRRAYTLASKVLIVSVRTDRPEFTKRMWGDGHLTGHGTFQKIYTQYEFKDYLEQTLNAKAYMVSLGIAYVFKSEIDETRFVSSRAISRYVTSEQVVVSKIRSIPEIAEYASVFEVLGRPPTHNEWPPLIELEARIGSPALLQKLAKEKVDPTKLVLVQTKKRAEIASALALLWLRRQRFPSLGSLAGFLDIDIKSLFPSYKAACDEATALLFSLGKEGVIAKAARSATVGKLVGDDFYVHSSAISALPNELKLLYSCAELVVGAVPFDLIKFKLNGKAVSLLVYKDFEIMPHPELQFSIKVDLPTGRHQIRNYGESTNPPILHRKELFVLPDYPGRETFEQLTAQEEAAGLLSRGDIGFKKQWEDVLTSEGFVISDGLLRKIISG